jgi:2'-hydroxyisoflavone reductase
MRILVIGGTNFLGRHTVEVALDRGHGVALFNRGRTNPGLFADAEELRGDRRSDLSALEGRSFDAVLDICGYIRREVVATAELLSGATDRYVFVSSISAYADFGAPGQDEGAPLAHLDDPDVEDVDEHYGGLKAVCEREVTQRFGERATIVRPGLIVGPFDPTNRFTYWVRRMADGGEVLVPGPEDRPVQFLDARDLATWMVASLDPGLPGTFNATSPAMPALGAFEAIREGAGGDAELVWVDGDWLLEQGVGEWMELPLWAPGAEGLMAVDVRRALDAGLEIRPVADTARDTWEWVRTLDDPPGSAGLDRAKERSLLATHPRSVTE